MDTQELLFATQQLYLTDENTFATNFSTKRISSIGGQKKYQDYFEITKALYPAMSTIEIVLRNRIDHTLQKHSMNWLMDFYFYDVVIKKNFQGEITLKMKTSIEKVLFTLGAKNHNIKDFWEKNKEAIHHLLISKLTFGFWIMLLHNEKTLNNIYKTNIDFAKNIFPKLETRLKENLSLFFSLLHHESKTTLKPIKDKLFPSDRTLILASFLTSIRNRLSHCEFLFKRKKSITTKNTKIKAYLKDSKKQHFEIFDFNFGEF